jgi:AcrR family transcriptional regulator
MPSGASDAAAPALSSGDGRARRSARSRAAIEAALFELVGEGILEPTAQQVAARAGIAMRSVFRHFADRESLFASIDARLRVEAMPLVLAAQPTGSPSDRVRDMVRLRATIFERITHYKHAGDLERRRSPVLQSQHKHLVSDLRAGLQRWLPELATAPVEIAEGLELVTSFEAWSRLRTEQHLGPARARAVMTRTAMLLVQALERNGLRPGGSAGRPAKRGRKGSR